MEDSEVKKPRGFSDTIKEFAKVRMEQTPNNTQIARDIKNKFDVDDKNLENIRKRVSEWREEWSIRPKDINIKRLFFDIETSYYQLLIKSWQLKNFQSYFNHEDIVREKEIICISYKWQYENKVHTLDWSLGEKEMLKTFIEILNSADEVIGHNGDKFDIKFLRTRCLLNGVMMFPDYRTLDTLKKSRNSFLFASNKLDYLGRVAGIGGKMEHEGRELWDKTIEGDIESLNKMKRYCERDVAILEDYYFIISPFINHNNNFAVLTGGDRWDCPECASKDIKMYRTYSTPMGVIRREMKCNQCEKKYKISNKTYMHYLENLTRANYQ